MTLCVAYAHIIMLFIDETCRILTWLTCQPFSTPMWYLYYWRSYRYVSSHNQVRVWAFCWVVCLTTELRLCVSQWELIYKYFWASSSNSSKEIALSIVNMRAEEHSIPNIDVSANSLRRTVSQTQYHISSGKHLHQVFFGFDFCISVVRIWVLVGANLRQWVWYGQECLTYVTLLD